MGFIKIGGGSGSGLTLGPVQNTFTGASQSAAETARDTYTTANADWVAEYNDEPTLLIQLTGFTGAPVFQRRNSAGTAWESATNVVIGQRGITGDEGPQGIWYARIFTITATAPSAAPTGGSIASDATITAPTGYVTEDSITTPGTGEEIYESIYLVNPDTSTFPITNPSWSFPFGIGDTGGALAAMNAQTAAMEAETAQTAAEAAQTAAETAQTNAETAETGAEAAQTAAEAAQSGAETALLNSGTALAFNDLWSGDMDITTANQWKALGTDAVPASATWLLWNGGAFSAGTDDGPAALTTWINAADWRALTADTVDTTPGDGTGMLMVDWGATNVGDGTPDFARRDALIGRTSANIPLITSTNTGEDFYGATLRYITQAVSTPGSGGGGASSFSDLSGSIADSQVPSSFTRDTELASLVDDITISGTTLTITFQDASTTTRTLPNGFTLRYGSTAPDNADGIDGDWYMRTTLVGAGQVLTHFHEKVSGAWTVRFGVQPAVVSQAEAEAGTSTTNRLWSAQRVAQAIAAQAALLSGATFTGAVSGITPTADANFATKSYVDGRTNMPTHTTDQYVAVKATSTFVAADFTGANGVAFDEGSATATIPDTIDGNIYVGLARLMSDPDAVFLDIGSAGFNQIGASAIQADTVEISSSTYEVRVTENAIDVGGDLVEYR